MIDEQDLQLLRDYRHSVGRALHDYRTLRVKSQPIFNRTGAHAAIILEHVFRAAERELLILSGSLNPNGYATEEATRAISDLLRRGGSVRIALDKVTRADIPVLREHKLFAMLLANSGLARGVNVHLVPPDVAGYYKYHFVIADGESFRFEHDKDAKLPHAFGQFGETEVAERLRKRFNEIWERSDDITSALLGDG